MKKSHGLHKFMKKLSFRAITGTLIVGIIGYGLIAFAASNEFIQGQITYLLETIEENRVIYNLDDAASIQYYRDLRAIYSGINSELTEKIGDGVTGDTSPCAHLSDPVERAICETNLPDVGGGTGTTGGTNKFCAVYPSYLSESKATFTPGTPTTDGQVWQNANSENPCYYTCKVGYTGNNCVKSNVTRTGWMQADQNCDIPDIQIGNQIWAGCNSTLGNGVEYTGTASTNDLGNDTIGGKFYTWDAQSSACPTGWKVPARSDFQAAFATLGCQPYNPGYATSVICPGLGWTGNGNTFSNKLKLPLSGQKDIRFGPNSQGRGGLTYLATSTLYESNSAYRRSILVEKRWDKLDEFASPKTTEYSIRCIKDGTGGGGGGGDGTGGGGGGWGNNFACATKPSYLTDTNATFTTTPATSTNQAWVQGASSCGYTCKTGYDGTQCAQLQACQEGFLRFPNNPNFCYDTRNCSSWSGYTCMSSSGTPTCPTGYSIVPGKNYCAVNNNQTYTARQLCEAVRYTVGAGWSHIVNSYGRCIEVATGLEITTMPANSCLISKPSYLSIANAEFVTGTPTKPNQEWTWGGQNCGYTCKSGFSTAICSANPVENTPTPVTCTRPGDSIVYPAGAIRCSDEIFDGLIYGFTGSYRSTVTCDMSGKFTRGTVLENINAPRRCVEYNHNINVPGKQPNYSAGFENIPDMIPRFSSSNVACNTAIANKTDCSCTVPLGESKCSMNFSWNSYGYSLGVFTMEGANLALVGGLPDNFLINNPGFTKISSLSTGEINLSASASNINSTSSSSVIAISYTHPSGLMGLTAWSLKATCTSGTSWNGSICTTSQQ